MVEDKAAPVVEVDKTSGVTVRTVNKVATREGTAVHIPLVVSSTLVLQPHGVINMRD